MPEELLRYRSEFPILDATTYLISNSLGAMPRGVEDSLHHYTELWNTRGVRAWEDEWWMLAAASRRRHRRAVQRARGLGRVPAKRHHVPGNGGLVPRLQRPPQQGRLHRPEFSFGDVLLGGAASARGARVQMVPNDDTIHVNTERLLDAIDEETLMVPISHVIFRSAFIQDVEAIVEKAHRVGALRSARFLPGDRNVAVRRTETQRGFLHRRRVEVAMRGAGNGVSLRAS